jgi:hypothetical protein
MLKEVDELKEQRNGRFVDILLPTAITISSFSPSLAFPPSSFFRLPHSDFRIQKSVP